MLKDLLQKQRTYLDHFFSHIDLEEAQKLVDQMLACQGTLVFTGVGKSGIVAEKIAVTMTSTGTKAIFLSPTNALHGDIGIVNTNDLFLILSKSGESEELLQLIPFLRNRRVPIIGIVCHSTSRLARACDTVIALPLAKELCPFDLVPTTSTAMQMMFGDLISIALMQARNFSLDEYANNHPAGRIGKRITLRVADLMLKDTSIPVCSVNDRVMDTLVELSDKKCGCILVIDELKRLLGIFTDGDLRRSLQAKGAEALEATIGAMMNPKPKTIAPTELAWRAMQVMEGDQKKPVTALPVVDENQQVVGIVKMHDIIQSGLS